MVSLCHSNYQFLPIRRIQKHMEYHDTRILIADESITVRAQLKEALLRAGYRHVEEASGGDEALSKIDRLHPDIAIIDIW